MDVAYRISEHYTLACVGDLSPTPPLGHLNVPYMICAGIDGAKCMVAPELESSTCLFFFLFKKNTYLGVLSANTPILLFLQVNVSGWGWGFELQLSLNLAATC